MKTFLTLCLMTLCFISLTSANLYYEVDVTYKDGELMLTSSDVVYSRTLQGNIFLDNESVPSYTFELAAKDGSLIHREKISVPLQRIIHYGENGIITSSDIIYDTDVSFTLYLPYEENTHAISIYDGDGSKIAISDVSPFATNKEKGTPNQGSITGGPTTFDNTGLWYVLVAIVLLVALSVVFYMYLRKKK